RTQLSEEEYTLLLAYASANLSGASNVFAGLPRLERHEMNDEAKERLLEWGKGDEQRSDAAGALECENTFGGFVDHGRAYRVSASADRLPPAPWVNVAANPQFGFLVGESGSGYTWSENSRENRLSPWKNDPVSDPSGEFALLADARRRKVWSLTPLPGSTRA